VPTRRIRGIQVVFEDVGSGPPALFIHGHPFNRTMWRPQLGDLQDCARLLVPDLRGFGESGVSPGTVLLDEIALDLAVLLDDLGIDRVVLVGLSMGGQIALDFCRLFPARVRGLVIAASSAREDTPGGYARRYRVAERLLQEGMKGYLEEELPNFIGATTMRTQPAIVDHVRTMILSTNPVGAAAALRGRAERRDHVESLAGTRVQSLIIVGADDRYTPVPEAQLLAMKLPRAQLAVLPGIGHMPNLEAPQQFNALIRQFLSDLPRP
jgi:pimeloyl-ACP methyl ester carboxylesterase